MLVASLVLVDWAALSDRRNAAAAPNLANNISRGSFAASFFMMCIDVIGVRQVSLETQDSKVPMMPPAINPATAKINRRRFRSEPGSSGK